jgi:hypothetical protein
MSHLRRLHFLLLFHGKRLKSLSFLDLRFTKVTFMTDKIVNPPLSVPFAFITLALARR